MVVDPETALKAAEPKSRAKAADHTKARSRSPLRRKPKHSEPIQRDPKHTRPITPPGSPRKKGSHAGSSSRGGRENSEPPLRRKREEVRAKQPKPTEAPTVPKWYEYRYGATNVEPEQWDDRPRALLLFSGRPRQGDLASYLHELGWIVVVVDKVGPIPVDLLDKKVNKQILTEVRQGMFDVVGVATPCETFSPLRENPPGPRPLRDLQNPDGLSRKKLNQTEVKQLDEANHLVLFSRDVLHEQREILKGFWMENPDHKEKLDIWKTSWFEKFTRHGLTNEVFFDQCMLGAEVTKPTKFIYFKMDFDDLTELRCNHEPKEWVRQDGSKYQAPHESLVQRWRTNEEGVRERASKRLAEYPQWPNKRIAMAMLHSRMERPERLRKLLKERIP